MLFFSFFDHVFLFLLPCIPFYSFFFSFTVFYHVVIFFLLPCCSFLLMYYVIFILLLFFFLYYVFFFLCFMFYHVILLPGSACLLMSCHYCGGDALLAVPTLLPVLTVRIPLSVFVAFSRILNRVCCHVKRLGKLLRNNLSNCHSNCKNSCFRMTKTLVGYATH